MGLILSPTGGSIRNDLGGSGYFWAKRGDDKHEHLDFDLPGGPGQNVMAPIAGPILRVSKPYEDDTTYNGCIVEGSYCGIQMFYLDPDLSLVGKFVRQGQVIGTAQDISLKYPSCLPHVHLRVLWFDFTILL